MKKKQVYNPYLPLQVCIPDGEPHVFGDRVYVYGSHDKFGGSTYCELDYEVWSAPINDLSNWINHGVSYRKEQDPSNKDGNLELWAPDVTQGADGRYYLYYCLAFRPEIGVAVSNQPEGPFTFYGHVKYDDSIRDGADLHENLPFDPAVFVDDDERIYLYYGFSPASFAPTMEEVMDRGLSEEEARLEIERVSALEISEYNMVVELQKDMMTMIGEPKEMIPGVGKATGTEYEGHAFFEASSMRKIRGRYYFVYSSTLSHELCYAISKYPDHDFHFGGTIISNGDIGLEGGKKIKGMIGNNHGGIVCMNDQYYIFYHRQTQGTETSRQGCAEPITIEMDGSIRQVEMTSCGLNGGPLCGHGIYPAAIACNIISPKALEKIKYGDNQRDSQPYIMGEEVCNIFDGVTVGYKYFMFENLKEVRFAFSGKASGTIVLSTDDEVKKVIGKQCITGKEQLCTITVNAEDGKQALFVSYYGTESINIKTIELC